MHRVESLKRLIEERAPWLAGPARLIYSAVTSFRRPNWPDAVARAVLIDNHVHDDTRRTVWIIAFTGVSNEPRVIRQARALTDAGCRVVVFGYDGHSARPDDWIFVRLPIRQTYSAFRFQMMRIARAIGQGLYRFMPGKIRDSGARLYFDNIPNWVHIRTEVLRVARDHPELAPDLIAVHDYFTSPLGADLAEYFAAKLSVDCHEYAAGQYMHDPEWVKKTRPWVVTIQDDYLRRADLVTTVSDGIAERLNEEHSLKRPVQVVRSVPICQSQQFKPTGEHITVLYHGDISYVRGLHKAVKSMPLWRPELRLVIRGPGDPAYIDRLKQIARDSGVGDRLTIEPPVPFDDIVPAANAADIGYFVHKDLSAQKRYTLPNKFFEYVMAGLALCVSDLPEMAKLVRQYDLGLLVSEYDEQAIADALNSLTREDIDRYKQASLAASASLNWDNEQKVMVQAYDDLFVGDPKWTTAADPGPLGAAPRAVAR